MKYLIIFFTIFSPLVSQDKSTGPKFISSFHYPNIKYESNVVDGDDNLVINENMSEGTGQFIRTDSDTTKSWTGGFKGDYFHGTGTLTFSRKDGKSNYHLWEEERSYDNGKVYGKSIRNYNDGEKTIYLWKNGKPFYFETVNKSGVLEQKAYYKNGTISHRQELNADGTLNRIEIYPNGLKGVFKRLIYSPNGNIEIRGQMDGKTGKPVGLWVAYYEGGSIGAEVYYSDDGKGTKISEKTYNEKQKYDSKKYNDSNYEKVIYYDIDLGNSLADKDGYVAMSKSEWQAKKTNERTVIIIYILIGIVLTIVISMITQARFNNNMKKKYGDNSS